MIKLIFGVCFMLLQLYDTFVFLYLHSLFICFVCDINSYQTGGFVYSTIVEKQGSKLKIHCDGFSEKFDCYFDYEKETHGFAKAGSISKRAAHRLKNLKKGDFIDLNPLNRHPGWCVGEIRRLSQKSGQVQVVYQYQDKEFLYWTHLDNETEVAEFASKTVKTSKSSKPKSDTNQDMLNNICKKLNMNK